MDSVKKTEYTEQRRGYSSQPDLIAATIQQTTPVPSNFKIVGKHLDKLFKTRKAAHEIDNVTPVTTNLNKRPVISRVEFSDQTEVHLVSQDNSELSSARNEACSSAASPQNCLLRQLTKESNSSAEEFFAQAETSEGGDHRESCSGYLVTLMLKEGRDLAIRDASGTSDPYVKLKHKNRLIYKSTTIFKNLNPNWNESFQIIVDDLLHPISVEVFDYDRFALDDFMGSAVIPLQGLELNKSCDLKIPLEDEKSAANENLGYITMHLLIAPQTAEQKLAMLKKLNSKSNSDLTLLSRRTQKSTQVWTSVVSIGLVEGRDLLGTEFSSKAGLPDPYVKFKIGLDKHKSKVIFKSRDPKWLEQFDLHVYDELNQLLQIAVYDKHSALLLGRCEIDLSKLEREVPHQKWYELDNGAGWILLLISITGTVGSETVSDLQSYEASPVNRHTLLQRYSLSKSLANVRDVGFVAVKVYKAFGLASADLGGKSDPFCVVELINARLQTHTEYKTLNPEWNKIFTFNVKDIHSVLEVTIFDEDANKQAEFLGKVAIPLLKIRNGEKRWYALKDRKLQKRVSGQILLELDVVFNSARACLRTFLPREKKYMQQDTKFKRQIFMRNVMRVKQFGQAAVEMTQFVQSCWSWENPLRSVVAFFIYLLAVYFAELYMLPLLLLLLFLKGYICKSVDSRYKEDDEYCESDDEEEGLDDKESPKKGLKEKLQAAQDTLAMVQNVLDYIASLLERIKNAFNFSQPFLSWLAIFILALATVVLYFIPLRWILLVWGINKFTKRLRGTFIDNNELLDYLSRVPSDDEMRAYLEFRPEAVDSITSPRRSHRRSPTSS